MDIRLETPETFETMFSQASIVGDYKRYQVCWLPSFGYFLVQPDHSVITLVGMVVYTASPQEAGQLIDQLLVTKKKPSRPARISATPKRSPTHGKRQKTASTGKRKTPTR